MALVTISVPVRQTGFHAVAAALGNRLDTGSRAVAASFDTLETSTQILIATLQNVIKLQAAPVNAKENMAVLADLVAQHQAEETKVGKARLAENLVDAVASMLSDEETTPEKEVA